MSDTLVREGAPPVGRVASPVPQHWDNVAGDYERVWGDDHAPRMQALTGKIVDLKTLLDEFIAEDFATQTTLSALQTATGASADAVVDAGAVGTLSAKLRRLTADLGALLTAFNAEDFAQETTLQAFSDAFDAKVEMELYGNGAPGAHAGEPAGTAYLDVDGDDLYISTGSAWVLKMEDIWD